MQMEGARNSNHQEYPSSPMVSFQFAEIGIEWVNEESKETGIVTVFLFYTISS
ncbi:hypothetical protein LEP1GSC202_2540 [Leptospira yanagawae serovar Saopaulo str. Sao Paulo = ATCC 700523]|uniref:Uncharacterized protein n=1 Tax=Leptospira yanagawae serovar Saopaulo str. Sao Paulo = ATCC 700523 TaxID=1249483 RepID=A0A5E8H924_9LEPT|nr:hypothetical protein [Leptospira yanagawae]EOQ87217.1 hypothetical protein LEP1GSC202_2540 [Leptospira yanagawae serovar Saopaulo str. Sao Paulo = ATCC 700523]